MYDLVFIANNWFALAKLHQHSDTTLRLLDKLTADLGRVVRQYATQTAGSNMVELPTEAAARKQRSIKQAQAAGTESKAPSAAQPRPFNINTFKLHNLGNYTHDIKMFGTTDSFTTAIVSYSDASS